MKKINKGDKFYVFTSWGLVKGTVIKYNHNKVIQNLCQYKLNIDISKDNLNKPYGFWYNEERLYKYYGVALVKELYRHLFKFILE